MIRSKNENKKSNSINKNRLFVEIVSNTSSISIS